MTSLIAEPLSAGPIFHIGYHRTGTTYFQQVVYPSVDNAVMLARRIVRQALIAPRALDFDPHSAREALIEAAGGRQFIACEENLSGYIHNGGLGGLVARESANRIHACFPEARIVIFIRSQPAIVLASYAQYVRGGGTYNLKEYVFGQTSVPGAQKHWYKSPVFSLDHFRYGPLIEYYRSLFGVDRVHVKLFELFSRDTTDFLRDYASEMRLELDVSRISTVRVNSSLPPRSLAILRRLNLLTGRSVQNKRVLVEIEDWYERRWAWLRGIEKVLRWSSLDRERSEHSALVLAAIERSMASDNSKLSKVLDLDLSRYGYPAL